MNINSQRPKPKGVDGFFVWRGPLPTTQGSDGEEGTNKDTPDTKRTTNKTKAGQKRVSSSVVPMDVDGTASASKTKGSGRKPRAKGTTEDKERKQQQQRKKDKETLISMDDTQNDTRRSASVESDSGQAITRESTIGMEVEVDMENDALNTKRKNSKDDAENASTEANSVTEPDKKRRKQVLAPLAEELVVLLDELKEAAKNVVFEKKGKFPAELKPALLSLALTAQYLSSNNEFDDDFIGHVATVLPFRKNDIRKLVHRTVFPEQLRMLETELKQTVKIFRKQVDAVMAVQLPQYEDGLARTKSSENTELVATNNEDTKMTDSQAEDGDGMGKNTEDSSRKFRWTRELRSQFWQIIDLREQIAHKESQIQGLHTKAPDVKPQSIRKQVYADIVGFWPEGWMTTNLLSREYSAYKRLLGTGPRQHPPHYLQPCYQ
ncbi:Ubinuclein conserved middle domain-containing protein [Syncephalis fuscata]|nr:Ubinuclein conserved middle domain-containing protein [Syncephalis fuscata]